MRKRKGGNIPKRNSPFDFELLENKLKDIIAHFSTNVPGSYPRFDELLQTVNTCYLWGSSEVIPELDNLFGVRKISTPGPYDREWFREKIAVWCLYYRSDLDTLRYDAVVSMINVAARLLDNGLEVKASQNPAAGNGLFTTRLFEEGAVLTNYGGYLSSVDTLECLALDDVYRQYVLAIPDETGRILDAQVCFRLGHDMGRWPNSIQGTGKTANACFDFDSMGTAAVIRAVRNIEAGEEVLLDYGNKFKI